MTLTLIYFIFGAVWGVGEHGAIVFDLIRGSLKTDYKCKRKLLDLLMESLNG
jgi:hypothetical protein